MNLEKRLRLYLSNNGYKISEDELLKYIAENSNSAVNIIFKLLNEELNNLNYRKKLDRARNILEYIEIIILKNSNVNDTLLERKIKGLEERLQKIKLIKKPKYNNYAEIRQELKKIENALKIIKYLYNDKRKEQYKFISQLLFDCKCIDYVINAVKKVPSIINTKSNEGVSIFRKVLHRYLISILELDKEEIEYYRNILMLLSTRNNFILENEEKRQCTKLINRYINIIKNNKTTSHKIRCEQLKQIREASTSISNIKNCRHDIKSIAQKYYINVDFDPSVLKDARLLHIPKKGKIADRELIEDYVISIDKEGTVEIDDALSCKRLPNGNYLLIVHIASVLAHFPYKSKMVQDAIKRNQTIYLPKSDKDYPSKLVPIFPFEFCADKGSLLEGKKRLARSYFFEIDKDGNIVNEKFAKTIIVNNKRLTYSEANNIIANGTKNKNIDETINNLYEVAAIIAKRYQPKKEYLDEKQKEKDISELRVTPASSENIIYQTMLLTGNRVAEFFARNNYPLLYRINIVDENLISSHDRKVYNLDFDFYPVGWYGIKGRHDGLNIDYYCHCTSELRRAADIIVEHALEVCYDKKPTKKELNKLKKEIADKAIEINAGQLPVSLFAHEYYKNRK